MRNGWKNSIPWAYDSDAEKTKEQAWLRDPQRYPVRIHMLGYEA